MRIDCRDIDEAYTVKGVRCEKMAAKGTATATASFRVMPKRAAWLSIDHQKIVFEQGQTSEKSGSTLVQFATDAFNGLMPFVMLFDGKRTPAWLQNHKEIVKHWADTEKILMSKYSGSWVRDELNRLRGRVKDEDRLLNILRTHFIISELYGRNIYNIRFDSYTGTGKEREWTETALGVPLRFRQSSQLTHLPDHRQKLIIQGHASLEQNAAQVKQLCQKMDIAQEMPISIKQLTEYTATDLSALPGQVHSLFSLHGERGVIHSVEISLTINEEQNGKIQQ